MKVVLNSLTNLSGGDRQLIYDALYIYLQHCNRQVETGHFGANVFRELAKRTEEIIIDLRAAWPDLLH